MDPQLLIEMISRNFPTIFPLIQKNIYGKMEIPNTQKICSGNRFLGVLETEGGCSHLCQ
jgi:hypothetical protein